MTVDRVLDGAGQPLAVLQSFPLPRPNGNPYTALLHGTLQGWPELKVTTFSWKEAILGRYDVFHAHWPEILVNGQTPLKKTVRQFLTVLLLIRFAVLSTAVVRTVHNVELPEGLSRVQTLLLRWFDSLTVLNIRLNSLTALPDSAAKATIPHGHYRDWYGSQPVGQAQPGQLCYVGLIRRYKGVESLVDAFRLTAANHPDLKLTIAGRPSSDILVEALKDAAGDDRRITLDLRQLEDPDFVQVVTSSELVVLPYRFMHNSAAAITALSLNRPILVPDNAVNRLLADEVGQGWVHLYREELSSTDLLRALREVHRSGDRMAPNLSAREWADSGLGHAVAYQEAVRAARSRKAFSSKPPSSGAAAFSGSASAQLSGGARSHG